MVMKLIKKKRAGQSDMISSFFVIFSLSVILLMSISFIKDMFCIIQLDQIARQGILLVETEGKLTSSNEEYISGLLEELGADPESITVELVTKSGSKYVPLNLSANKTVGYGNKITLHIKCKLPKTTIESKGVFFTLSREISDDDTYSERYKSSIAKY